MKSSKNTENIVLWQLVRLQWIQFIEIKSTFITNIWISFLNIKRIFTRISIVTFSIFSALHAIIEQIFKCIPKIKDFTYTFASFYKTADSVRCIRCCLLVLDIFCLRVQRSAFFAYYFSLFTFLYAIARPHVSHRWKRWLLVCIFAH